MSWKPKLGVNWRQFVVGAAGAIVRALFIGPEFLRERRILVREPGRAEIEYWLRNRN
ncbi:hypothetical protein [Methylocystis sp. B8]|uniref:hypothetical protein n=1 Tax=Methylocystis sp. B8 TaxID=544938 RepID=UPI001484E4A1|nr:hypothetical protein [Methylocystis sp. B8]